MLFDKPRINDSTRNKEYRLIGGSISQNVDIYLPSNISGSNNIFALKSDIDSLSGGSGLFIVKTPSVSTTNTIVSSSNAVPLTIQKASNQTANLLEIKNDLGVTSTIVDVSGFIGRTNSPNCIIDLYSNMDAEPTFLRITGSYGSSANSSQFGPNWSSKGVYGGGGAPVMQFRRSRGTISSPRPVKAFSVNGTQNDVLGTYGALGYGATDWAQAGRAMMQISTATSASGWVEWTDSNQGAHITFWTTAVGTTSQQPKFRIDDLGNLIHLGSPSINATSTSNSYPFLYLKGCKGTPSGIPTRDWSGAGQYPIQIDATNEKLYFFNAGSWRSLTGAISGTSSSDITKAEVAVISAGLDSRIDILEAQIQPDIFRAEVASISANLQTQINNISIGSSPTSGWTTSYVYDFEDESTATGILVNYPFTQKIFYSATITSVSVSGNKHFGVKRIALSSTTGSGVWYTTSPNVMYWDANSSYKIVGKWKMNVVDGVIGNNYVLLSVKDVTSGSAWANNAHIQMYCKSSDAIYCATTIDNNGTVSNGGTPVGIDTNTWYRAEIETISTTAIKFSVYNDDTGALLWTYTKSDYLPLNRNLGVALSTYNASGFSIGIADFDFLGFYRK